MARQESAGSFRAIEGIQQIVPALSVTINIAQQRLYVMDQERIIKTYRISTSKFGIGNKTNSYMTPLGLHMIVSKIGRNARINTIFKNRRNTGRVARIDSEEGDHITTRILRLEGLEQGKNRGRGIDTFKRCIYIHGTPHERKIGSPASHGCIRMTNADIIDLFERLPRGTLVNIVDK